MSHTLTIEEAGSRLADLLSELKPGETITLTEKDRPVARVVPTPAQTLPRAYGACKGMLVENPDVDENAHLEDFKEYM